MDYVFAKKMRIYFIMKYVSGGDLLMLLREKKKLPESQVIFYAG
jgi:serine/threonine protein kinase